MTDIPANAAELLDNPNCQILRNPYGRGFTLFHLACRVGRLDLVQKYLQHPNLQANIKIEDLRTKPEGLTGLHLACDHNHGHIVEALLTHNRSGPGLFWVITAGGGFAGRTALHMACRHGTVEMVRMLLDDPRSDGLLTLKDECRENVLHEAAAYDHLEIFELLLADNRVPIDEWRDTTPWSQIRGDKCSILFHAFHSNPRHVRSRLRRKWGFLTKDVATRFALVVALTDGYFKLLRSMQNLFDVDRHATLRFFGIVSRLPMELQMLVCHRTQNSSKTNIRSQDFVAAFVKMTK